MSHQVSESLSEYLDGGLSPAERREIEAHLATCTDCTDALRDLEDIVARAQMLPQTSPPTDLWPGIMAQIKSPPRPRRRWLGWSPRIVLTVPQLAAACVAAMVLSGGLVWYMTHSARRPEVATTPGPMPASTAATLAESENAIRDVESLQRVLASGREDLDPATVKSLEESLAIIDLAIRQAQRALIADPHNPYVKSHLDETMRRKVDLMRRATQLASAEGAADR